MAIPRITLSGKVVKADGTTASSGTVTFTLSNAGATVTDDADSGVQYKIGTATIAATVDSSGEIKASDGTSPLQLVPNALITPENTYYVMRVRTDAGEWRENVSLTNIDQEIGDLTYPATTADPNGVTTLAKLGEAGLKGNLLLTAAAPLTLSQNNATKTINASIDLSDYPAKAESATISGPWTLSQNAISIGDGSDGTKTIFLNEGSANNPGLRFEHTTNKMQFSHDGSEWREMGSGNGSGGVSGVSFYLKGNAYASEKVQQISVPQSATISEVFFRSDTTPSGSSLGIDVHLIRVVAGVPTDQGSILSSPPLAAAAKTTSTTVLDSTRKNIQKGDVLRLDIDSVGSTTPGGDDLIVGVVF